LKTHVKFLDFPSTQTFFFRKKKKCRGSFMSVKT
jgi:hypothetical protein